MISKRDLREQKLLQRLIELRAMGDNLVEAIEQANYKNVKRFKLPTLHMRDAVAMWKEYWEKGLK